MAAMLLSCASVFAQSGNTPAKGDVNEDGTVDVADIVAVIDIMKNGGGTATVGYFYLGTTKPTAENYKTLPGVVTTFTSFDAAVGATATVAAGQTLYLLCPVAWMEEKTPTLEDKDGNSISFLEEKDEVTISDYVIYKTQVWNAPNDVVLKTETPTYYWYVGQNSSDSYITADNYQLIATQSAFTTTTINMTAGNYLYIVVPADKTVRITDPAGYGVVSKYYSESHGTYRNATFTVDGYYIMRSEAGANEAWTITVLKTETPTYYWYVGQTTPTTTITEVTGANEGWHKIGTSIGTYTFASPLYNSESNPIAGSSKTNWYVAVPSTSSLSIYDSDDVNAVTNGNWTTEQQITAEGVTYNVYKSVGTYRNFNGFWVH